MKRWLLLALGLILAEVSAAGEVVVAEIRGAIGPATASYFERVLVHAQTRQASLLVVQLDTPGGLDSSMRDMIRQLLASPVPVAMFVAPSGARAASAGTYLLYASHVAAMAPGTNLGAATPVSLGPGAEREAPQKSDGKDQDGKPAATTMERKAMQDASAYLRSLAQLRGRNAEWAARAVMNSESLSAEEAAKQKVIDLLAADIPNLLTKIEGRRVRVVDHDKVLTLAGATIVAVAPNWKERLLSFLSNPNMALILMMVGVYGLFFEFYHPGAAVPGVIGGICLLLGAYGLALLPIDIVGAALMLLGIALMLAETFVPSFGVLGIGGVAAFVAGALMLVDSEAPGFTISLALVVPLAVASALVLFGLGGIAMRARRRRVVSGVEGMIGGIAEASEDFAAEGRVRAFGEMWRARSSMPLKSGQRARVCGVDGLTLIVEPETRPDGKGERT